MSERAGQVAVREDDKPCPVCDSPDLGEMCPVHDFDAWRESR